VPPQRTGIAVFKLSHTVSVTDKHLRERIGTITPMNAKTCPLICDGEQWQVSPALLCKVIGLFKIKKLSLQQIGIVAKVNNGIGVGVTLTLHLIRTII
jgi:hypothetical protein